MNTYILFTLIAACLIAAASAYPSLSPSPTPNELAELEENAHRLISESELEQTKRTKRATAVGDAKVDKNGGVGRYVIMDDTLYYVYRRNGAEAWVWKEGNKYHYIVFKVQN